MNKHQLRHLITRTLKAINRYSEDAVDLLTVNLKRKNDKINAST